MLANSVLMAVCGAGISAFCLAGLRVLSNKTGLSFFVLNSLNNASRDGVLFAGGSGGCGPFCAVEPVNVACVVFG
jgi:hypothetical protein